MLRGHFGVIKDEAKFYIEVSEQFIMPALDQVNMLPLSASEAQQRLAADKLTSHATESANAIAVIATKVRQYRYSCMGEKANICMVATNRSTQVSANPHRRA